MSSTRQNLQELAVEFSQMAMPQLDKPAIMAWNRLSLSLGDMVVQYEREILGEREARDKALAALRAKNEAMGVLFDRLRAAGIDYSDLVP
jgi:hypothetical protein